MEEMNNLENMLGGGSNMMATDTKTVSQADVSEAQAALSEIRALVQEMMAAGMSEAEIDAFLKQFGISLQDLALAEQSLGNPEIMSKVMGDSMGMMYGGAVEDLTGGIARGLMYGGPVTGYAEGGTIEKLLADIE